jgi:IS5 family transposase
MALSLKAVYHQTLRGTQGLLRSVLDLMHMPELPVPDYSTLCRRAQRLKVPLEDVAAKGAVHLVIDSTGCKVFGEGEWKVRQHGYSKRRTWRKMHLGIDAQSGQIKAAMVTTNNVADSEVLSDMLLQVAEPIGQLSGDGGYDKRPCYTALEERERQQGQPLKVTIPPRQGARIWRHGNAEGERLARDQNLRRIRQVGRQRWKEESNYHRRSLAETGMFRHKQIFGDELSARCFNNQATEVFVRCRILNKMTRIGMPESYLVEQP